MRTFPFPICVLLFNKPHESQLILTSLKHQTLLLDQSRIFISIDGYKNSKNEFEGKPDYTKEVEEIARNTFPYSTIIPHPENLGIARQFEYLENVAFKTIGSEWVFFQEDDFELGPLYLEVIMDLIQNYGHFDEIVELSATGDSLLRSDSPEQLLPMNHHWSFVLKKKHAIERNKFLKRYFDLIGEKSYFQRDTDLILNSLASDGIFAIGSSQDYVKHAIRRRFKRLSLTSSHQFGRYIGRTGEHFTEQIFNDLGYGNEVVEETRESLNCDSSYFILEKAFQDDDRVFNQELFQVWFERLSNLMSINSSLHLFLEQKENLLASTNDLLASTNDLLASTNAELTRIRGEEKKLIYENQSLLFEIQNHKSENEILKSQYQQTADQLGKILSSKSIKITKPLRMFARVLRSIRGI